MRILRSSSLVLARAGIAFALSVSVLTPASAANTFLLQLGQHDSEAEARTHWETLQQNHGDILQGLSLRIATVGDQYRTQALGLSGRSAAQDACSRLAVAEVTCQVVETSMYQPEETTAQNTITDNTAREFASATQAAAPVSLASQRAAAERDTPALVQIADDADMPEEFRISEQGGLTIEEVRSPATRASGSSPRGILPWMSGGSAAAVAAQQVEERPVAEAQPVEQPAWPEQIDRATASELSENLTRQSAVVPERAPRNLQARAPEYPATQDIAANAPRELAPQIAPAPAAERAANEGARIEVAEAIQVPLSSFGEGQLAPVPVNKPVGYAGFPSQPQPERTTWLQLGNFANKEAAMGYWRQLTTQNPELLRYLRVRIVAPWSSPGSGAPRHSASLRMGPFASTGEIDNICNVATQQGLRCSMVKEVGSSSPAVAQRGRRSTSEHYNRRAAVNRGLGTTPAAGMFWLQLGAFGSVTEAQQRWSQLQATHGDMLGHMQPQISYPALSSSPTPVYHLRTGPFAIKASAINTCNGLQNRRIGCVVVQSR